MSGCVNRLWTGWLSLVLVAGMVWCGEVEGVMKDGERNKPNIILIMIDDLGWMDLACQGNGRLDTPFIDRLAKEGVRFTDAYAAAPVCSPTRAAIMAGLTPARLKITNHLPDQKRFAKKNAPFVSAKVTNYLSDKYVTIAERLKEAGYSTAFMGKWHISGRGKGGRGGMGDLRYYPERQGYDINIGGCSYGGPPTFFDPYRIHNIKDRKKGEYLPYRLADEAIGFMKKNKGRPFFLTLWNYTVHWPMEAPKALVEKYKKRIGPGVKDARYAAMIEAMDKSIGQVVKAVDDMGLGEETMIIFTSDNGGFMGVADMRPLRMGKGYLYEGGIRVPLIVRWKGKVKGGRVSDDVVISTDFYLTMLEAAGLKARGKEGSDGESIMKVLTGKGKMKRDAIYFHYPNYAFHGGNKLGAAIREGDYKLILRFVDDSVELFDVRKDIGEKKDLAKEKPDLAKRLKGKLKKWLKGVDAEMPVRKAKR